jgi:hypothetical protein
MEDIINKNENKLTISYPGYVIFSISYNKNKNEFLLDILIEIPYGEREYIDLYYKKKGMEEERKIVYYEDGKRNKEIYIKNTDISPDKYIFPIVQDDEDYIFDENGKMIPTNIEKRYI